MLELRELYQELILDHGRHPRNFVAPAHVTHQATGHNPLCGDRLELFLDCDDSGIIQAVGFTGSGCAISVASASIMTELLKGRNLADAQNLFAYFHAAATGAPTPALSLSEDDTTRLAALAGVRQFPIRVKCATLAWHTLIAALQQQGSANTESTQTESTP